MERLPPDLVDNEILPRLPVKTLVGFTCVCKRWYSLIKSAQFVAFHFNLSQFQPKSQHLLFLNINYCRVVKNCTFLEPEKIVWPLDNICFFRYESCNGLVLLQYNYKEDYSRRGYFMWNPSVRKFKNLGTERYNSPHYKEVAKLFEYHLCGLGFHDSCNDYRVVRIAYPIDGTTSSIACHALSKVDVYSLRTNSWHSVDSSPGRLIGTFGGVFLNGAVHWFASTKSTREVRISFILKSRFFKSILLFDFEKECFREMVLPQAFLSAAGNNIMLLGLKVFEESLATFYEFDDSGSHSTSVWVMTEYGVAESWTQKFVIRHANCASRNLRGFMSCGIAIYQEHGDKNGVHISTDVFVHFKNNRLENLDGVRDHGLFLEFRESLALL